MQTVLDHVSANDSIWGTQLRKRSKAVHYLTGGRSTKHAGSLFLHEKVSRREMKVELGKVWELTELDEARGRALAKEEESKHCEEEGPHQRANHNARNLPCAQACKGEKEKGPRYVFCHAWTPLYAKLYLKQVMGPKPTLRQQIQ